MAELGGAGKHSSRPVRKLKTTFGLNQKALRQLDLLCECVFYSTRVFHSASHSRKDFTLSQSTRS